MLTTEEKNNVKGLLEVVPLNDLLSVAAVVTTKAVPIKTKEDAVKAILLHESSYSSILNRKKIKRNTLLNYLHSQEVTCDGSLEKDALIEKILNYWEKGTKNEGDNKNKKKDTFKNQSKEHRSNQNKTFEHQPFNIETELAKQFTTWYYDKLNEDFLKKGGPVIMEEDFWSDCQAVITLPETEEAGSQDYISYNAEDSVKLIRSLRSQYDLFFSPNVNFDGVKAKTEPHGLVLVMAYGTLHSRAGECVGVFEQMFGLIADPMKDNNFKIKKTSLSLKKNTQSQPLRSICM